MTSTDHPFSAAVQNVVVVLVNSFTEWNSSEPLTRYEFMPNVVGSVIQKKFSSSTLIGPDTYVSIQRGIFVLSMQYVASIGKALLVSVGIKLVSAYHNQVSAHLHQYLVIVSNYEGHIYLASQTGCCSPAVGVHSKTICFL